MRIHRIGWVTLAFAVCVSAAGAQGKADRGVCGAFGPDGSFAQARLSRSSLTVEVAPESGTVRKLVMPLILSGNTCHSFYSADGQLLALSIEDNRHPHAKVQVAVADLSAGKWLQSAPYAATVAEDARGPLVGFLGDTHTLLLMSGGTYFPDENRSLLYPVAIDLPQGSVRVGFMGFSGPAFTAESGTVDARDRTVFFSSLHDACGFGSQILGDKEQVKPGVSIKGELLRSEGCVQEDLAFALTPARLIVGFPSSNVYKFAEIDATSGKFTVVSLTAKGRQGFFKPLSVAVSPDAKSAAIEIRRFDDTTSGIKRAATEIVVLKGEPFQLAATLRVPAETDLLAVQRRGEITRVAVADRSGKISFLNAK